jgi:hypothetical protein
MTFPTKGESQKKPLLSLTSNKSKDAYIQPKNPTLGH